MDKSLCVRVSGPLAAQAPGFREELVGSGYAPRSAQAHLLLMARMSRWLDAMGVDAGELTAERAGEFLEAERALGRRFPRSAQGMAPLLSYLRARGVAPPETSPAVTASEKLLEQFRRHLLAERGLGGGTVVGYVHAAALFLRSVDFEGGRELAGLSPGDVGDFLLTEGGRRSVASTKCLVTGLRAVLRFFHVQGITDTSLAGSVPAVAGWSGTSLPRRISAESVRGLLAACDRRTRVGRRNFAVLMLLARLGMRVGEVAALELADVDWRGGQILVRGKGQRLERLPLPVDVGDALADYVQRGRPRGPESRLFQRVVAPRGPLKPAAIQMIVQTACDRAGLPRMGAHRLRHTVASELLRCGADLPEIGQVLRHRSIAATAIYAKVDTAALRQLARPWPGGAA
jgi:site-specific recombinase XerD